MPLVLLPPSKYGVRHPLVRQLLDGRVLQVGGCVIGEIVRERSYDFFAKVDRMEVLPRNQFVVIPLPIRRLHFEHDASHVQFGEQLFPRIGIAVQVQHGLVAHKATKAGMAAEIIGRNSFLHFPTELRSVCETHIPSGTIEGHSDSMHACVAIQLL